MEVRYNIDFTCTVPEGTILGWDEQTPTLIIGTRAASPTAKLEYLPPSEYHNSEVNGVGIERVIKPQSFGSQRIAHFSRTHFYSGDLELLESWCEQSDAPLISLTHCSLGMLVQVPQNEAARVARIQEWKLSTPFVELIDLCMEEGYQWMLIDFDGPVYPHLPEFD